MAFALAEKGSIKMAEETKSLLKCSINPTAINAQLR